MSRKDYEKIAAVLRRYSANRYPQNQIIEGIASCLIEVFEEDNPAFNEELFRKAVFGE